MTPVETEVLEPEEVEALLQAVNTTTLAGTRNYALLQLMVQTGIRCGEALAVTPDDVRLETWGANGDSLKLWVLRLPQAVTKGKKPRQGLPLTAATRQALQVWWEKREAAGIGDGPLFCTISEGTRQAGFSQGAGKLVPGKALDSRYVRDLVKRLARQAGITREVHPHMLRHTALTRLYNETHDLKLVSMVAGHSTTKMTERYVTVHPIQVAAAMGILAEREGKEAQHEG